MPQAIFINMPYAESVAPDMKTTLSARKSVKLFYILVDSVSQIIWSYTVRIWQFKSAPKGLKQFLSLENIRLLLLLAFVLEYIIFNLMEGS